ncbi:hypothetical protein [Devosia enhydra]|nr:hypothetical protein [Devosia enhydra]
MIRMTMLAGLISVMAAPATAKELYCLADASASWAVAEPRVALHDEETLGRAEFWVETETGDWRYRTVGSAALYSDGASLTVLADGEGYRQHWVGIEDHGGFASLRIALSRDPMRFVFADRDGGLEFGTCVQTQGREFFNGVERTQ